MSAQVHRARDYSKISCRQPVITKEVIIDKTAQPTLASTTSKKCSIIRNIELPRQDFVESNASKLLADPTPTFTKTILNLTESSGGIRKGAESRSSKDRAQVSPIGLQPQGKCACALFLKGMNGGHDPLVLAPSRAPRGAITQPIRLPRLTRSADRTVSPVRVARKREY